MSSRVTASVNAFIEAVSGKRLLHLGHKDADCDALGSAYAMSRLLPGDVGFAQGAKAAARDLASWLGLDISINPDPSAYDYTIIYDTINPSMLGLPLPSRYALFDHHEPGGHRFASFHNELFDGAEWAWVRPVESTCSLLIDLFRENDLAIDDRMATALAAGIITDTLMLRQANAAALSRLAGVLRIADLHVEDVIAVIDSLGRREARRSQVLEAIQGTREVISNGWSILAAEASSHDHAFFVVDLLKRLGADVSLVSFPKLDKAMIMAECDAAVVEAAALDLAGLMAETAHRIRAEDSWGTRALGRIIAPTTPGQLLSLCVDAVAAALSTSEPKQV